MRAVRTHLDRNTQPGWFCCHGRAAAGDGGCVGGGVAASRPGLHGPGDHGAEPSVQVSSAQCLSHILWLELDLKLPG